ncbi:MAG: adenosine deaminase [Spirochaetota bacterium]
MKTSFDKIIQRINAIDRDVGELNELKGKVSSDRPYSPSIRLAFDKQINSLINERVSLMELVLNNPPKWIEKANHNHKQNNITADALNYNKIPDFLTGDLSVANPKEKDIINFIKALPKTEIHLHLEACMNRDTLIELIKKNNIDTKPEEVNNIFNFEGLNGFINVFLFIQSSIRKPEDLKYMIDSLAQYLRKDNIIYAEVFFAPSKFIQNGLDFFAMVDVLIANIRRIKEEDGTEIRILVDVSRSFGRENAMNNLKKVLKLEYEEIIGIGLGGAELKGPPRDFEDIFRIAKESNLRVVAHAGEDDGPWAVWDAINILQAERIGHAISAIQDPKLIDHLKEKQIPIEICVTSNIFTGKYVKKEKHHPVRYYYDHGILTCINTDDPAIFNVDLSYEYFKLYRYLDFSLEEILDLIKKGVQATFHPNKKALWEKMEQRILQVKKDFKLS